MFFQMLGETEYPVNSKTIRVANLLRSALPKRMNVDRAFVFQNYDVPSGERPEMVAFKLYKQPLYHWTLLVVNGITDPYRGWPMSDDELNEYVRVKYDDDIYGIHHFVRLTDGRIVDDVDDAALRVAYPSIPIEINPITNYEYERALNAERSSIAVISPSYIGKFVEAFRRAMEGKA